MIAAILGLAIAPLACSDDDDGGGSEGEAEAEAEGEGSCEMDSATCDECKTCAEGFGDVPDDTAPCYSLALACQGNDDCFGILLCVDGCTDQACADACVADAPGGADDYNALASCEICGECPNDCADAFYVCS